MGSRSARASRSSASPRCRTRRVTVSATARLIWWIALVVGTVPFWDMPRLTLGSTRTRWVEHAARPRVVLALLEGALLVMYFVFARGRWEISASPRPVVLMLGAVLALAGALLAAWGKIALGHLFSATFGIKEGHRLVTSGPYALVRHPIYTGIITFIAGTALAWNDAALLLVAASFFVLFSAHVRVEERLFARHFGGEFTRYRASVPALLPWPRPRGLEQGPHDE